MIVELGPYALLLSQRRSGLHKGRVCSHRLSLLGYRWPFAARLVASLPEAPHHPRCTLASQSPEPNTDHIYIYAYAFAHTSTQTHIPPRAPSLRQKPHRLCFISMIFLRVDTVRTRANTHTAILTSNIFTHTHPMPGRKMIR